MGSLTALVATLLVAYSPSSPQSTVSQRQPILPAPAADLGSLTVPDLLARMPADAWDRSGARWMLKPEHAELRRRVETHSMSDDDWRAAIRASDVLHTRSRWVAREPFAIWIREPAWLAPSSIQVRAVEPDLDGIVADNLHPSTCGNCRESELDRQRALTLLALPANTTRIIVEVTIDHPDGSDALYGARDRRTKPQRAWQGRLEIPIETLATVDQVLPAATEPAVTQAVRDSTRVWWGTAANESAPSLCITVGDKFSKFPALRGVGVSLQIELRNGGNLVQRQHLVVNRSIDLGGRETGLRGFAKFGDLPKDLRTGSTDGWELRFASDPRPLLSLWDAERSWNGQFSMTLEQALSTTPAGPK